MKISVFGSGYVGLVTGACLANLGHEILCVDIDEEKINLLKKGDIHFYEPGLKPLVVKNFQKGRLRFTTDVQEAVNFSEAIFNCVGTPSREDGSADLKYVFSVAESVAQLAKGYKLLINKSTVPPGTAKRCQEKIRLINPESEAEVVSNPEFLAEGKAVHDFTHPDKIVVGAQSSKAYSILRKIYTGRVRSYIPFLETNWETAEMIKYANNSFLATKICFINEIANICDRVGADVKLISQAMGMDYRINPKFLNAGTGYGGSCFPKDVRALVSVASENGYKANLLQEVNHLNERQKKVIVNKLLQRFGENLSGKTFTVLGLSFKPNTSDIREAPSLVIVKELLERGAKINAYDPIASSEARKELGEGINYCESVETSAVGSSAILLITEWDEFRNIDFQNIGLTMQEKVVFDGRNIYEPEMLLEDGFEYFGVGRK